MRILSPEDYGRFAVVSANVGLVATFINFKTPDVVLQASEKDIKGELPARVGTAIVLESVLVALGGVGVLYLFDLLVAGAFIVLAHTLFTTWLNTEIRLFERGFDYRTITALEILAYITAYALTVLGAVWGFGAIVLYLRGALNAVCIAVGLWYLGALGSFPVRWLEVEEWKSWFHRVGGFWGDSILAQSFSRLLILIAGAIGTEATTGLFFQARRLARVPHQLFAPVMNRLVLNHLSRQIPSERRTHLRDILLGLVALLCPVVVMIWQFGDPVIPFLFGEDWGPVVPMLLLMAGVIVGKSTLDAVKVYCMSGNNMTRFLIAGRGGQYAGLAVGLLVMYVLGTSAGSGLSFALSLAFVVGTILSYLLVR